MKRKETIVLKIVDFWSDKDEPAIDVELYINNKFVTTLGGRDLRYLNVFSKRHFSKALAYDAAIDAGASYLKDLANGKPYTTDK